MNSQKPNTAKTIGSWFVYATWLVALIFLTLFFNKILSDMENPNQGVQGRVSSDGMREVILQRNKYGHYVASGQINGKDVIFMLDTGATDVSIPATLAAQLGLKRGAPATYQTANGLITSYRTRIPHITLGNIVLKDIRASINPATTSEDTILLGMSFLKKIEFTQKGKQLILRQ